METKKVFFIDNWYFRCDNDLENLNHGCFFKAKFFKEPPSNKGYEK